MMNRTAKGEAIQDCERQVYVSDHVEYGKAYSISWSIQQRFRTSSVFAIVSFK